MKMTVYIQSVSSNDENDCIYTVIFIEIWFVPRPLAPSPPATGRGHHVLSPLDVSIFIAPVDNAELMYNCVLSVDRPEP